MITILEEIIDDRLSGMLRVTFMPPDDCKIELLDDSENPTSIIEHANAVDVAQSLIDVGTALLRNIELQSDPSDKEKCANAK